MKTVFVTLPSPLVFRNFFLFPGNFFEQTVLAVKNDSKLRFVFLVQKRDLHKYEPFLRKDLSYQILIEPVDVSYEKGFLEKGFYFFYSYLLYTKTTWMLATMGMRPDEPPHKGILAMAPIKWLIANIFGRSLFVRNKIVPFLYYKVFKQRPFSALFEKYQPNLVFISSIYDRFDVRLLPEAKRRNVKTMGTPAGWDHVDKYFLPFKLDTLLVPSQQVRDHAIKYQNYSNDNIRIVGYPQFDFFSTPESVVSKDEVLKRLGLPANARYILYVSGSSYCPDEPDILEEIIKWLSSGKFGQDVYLVLRPYLGTRGRDKDFDEVRFEKLKTHPKVAVYDRKVWGDYQDSSLYVNMMRHAAVVMAVYSTVFMESVIFDRPLIATPFDGYKRRPLKRSIRRLELMEHFADVLDIGAIRRAHDFKQLEGHLAEYLRDPSIDADKRERFRQVVCYKLDGKASERIIKSILDYI